MYVSSHVEMLEIEGQQGKCYPVLLHGNGDLMLVDTGFPMQYPLILQAIEAAGFDPGALGAILLTHQDLDHIGNVREFLASNPSIKVMAHGDEIPYVDGRKTPIKLAAMPQDHPFYANFKAGFDNRRFPIQQALWDGEALPFFGGIQVIHTPGHTPGHICLFLRADHTLIAGDALNVKDGALAGPDPAHAQDIILANRSIQKLKDWDIQRIVTYHGGMLQGGMAGLRQ